MKKSFTPGPWAFAHESRRDQRFEVAQVENFRIYSEIFPPFPSTGRPEDDARLIAAAPLMLEALNVARDFMSIASDWNVDEAEINGEMRSTYEWLEVVDAAIAAATGEQP